MQDEDNFSDFDGWDAPESNYYKVPHCWVDFVSRMTSMAEIKVVNYILRHTWGFHECGIAKRISLDEFMHGRRRRDGSRMDAGTGLAKTSVLRGIEAALEHGFIVVEIDDRDAARVKKYYMLRMRGQQEPKQPCSTQIATPSTNAKQPCSTQIATAAVQDRYSSSTGSLHRTEKDTIERNKRKNTLSSPRGESNDSMTSASRFSLSGTEESGFFAEKEKVPPLPDFDLRCARQLYNAVEKNGKYTAKNNIQKWAVQFRLLRSQDGADQETVQRVLDWYCAADWTDKYMPDAWSGSAFRAKFEKLFAAMDREAKYNNKTPAAATEETWYSWLENGEKIGWWCAESGRHLRFQEVEDEGLEVQRV